MQRVLTSEAQLDTNTFCLRVSRATFHWIWEPPHEWIEIRDSISHGDAASEYNLHSLFCTITVEFGT